MDERPGVELANGAEAPWCAAGAAVRAVRETEVAARV